MEVVVTCSDGFREVDCSDDSMDLISVLFDSILAELSGSQGILLGPGSVR